MEVAINDNYYKPSYLSAYDGAPHPTVIMYSDHNTLGLFSPLSRIVISSSTLPVSSEIIQPASGVYTGSSQRMLVK